MSSNYIKSIFTATVLAFTLSACSDHEEKEKKAFDELIKLHNEVMETDERAMNNKLVLDSLKKQNQTAGIDTATISKLGTKLTTADEAMSDWMHDFEPDYKGKPHDEVMKYMADHKKRLQQIDDQLKSAIKESADYISKTKQK